MKIDVRFDIKGALRKLDLAKKQIPFAVARGLTWTARDVRQDVMAAMPQALDRPSPFTMRGIGYRPATKQTLTSEVFIRDTQATYLSKLISGGTRRPRGKALLVPSSDFPTDQYGNPSKAALRRLRSRKDVFSGTIRGVGGIWQRTGKGGRPGVKLLLAFEPTTQYRPTFPFVEIAKRSVAKRLKGNLERSIADAMRTAR